MNKTSTDKIRLAALFLVQFRRCLPLPVQDFVRPYLDQPYQLALRVMDCCSASHPPTMGEIAEATGVTRETVRQVLLALRDGGTRFRNGARREWQLLEEEVLGLESADPELANIAAESKPAESVAATQSG